MKLPLQIWKTLVLAFILGTHILVVTVAKLFLYGNQRRSFILALVSKNARAILTVLNITVEVENDRFFRPGQNYFIVANHMGYLDGLILAAYRPICFVTSMEMKETPGLGLCTEAGGCLYVERRSKENIHNEILEIEAALRDGYHVAVFPEATSTDGARVLPFKRPLFRAPANVRVPVLPLVLQYESLDGEKVTSKNRDFLCWYGDMPFTSHLFALTGFRKIRVRLKVLEEIPATAASSRDTLMEAAYSVIAKQYEPIV